MARILLKQNPASVDVAVRLTNTITIIHTCADQLFVLQIIKLKIRSFMVLHRYLQPAMAVIVVCTCTNHWPNTELAAR